MSERVLFSVIESSTHPNFSALYKRCGLNETRFNAMRKTIAQLKKQKPDFLVAEFFYGYGNNYAGVNVSNLDTLLSSLQKYSPQTRVIVLVDKSEHQHVAKLQALFPIHAVITLPAQAQEMEALLLEQPA